MERNLRHVVGHVFLLCFCFMVTLFWKGESVFAGEFDNAFDFYEKHGDDLYPYKGDIWYVTKAGEATGSLKFRTIGYSFYIKGKGDAEWYVDVKRGGTYCKNIKTAKKSVDGFEYNLYYIPETEIRDLFAIKYEKDKDLGELNTLLNSDKDALIYKVYSIMTCVHGSDVRGDVTDKGDGTVKISGTCSTSKHYVAWFLREKSHLSAIRDVYTGETFNSYINKSCKIKPEDKKVAVTVSDITLTGSNVYEQSEGKYYIKQNTDFTMGFTSYVERGNRIYQPNGNYFCFKYSEKEERLGDLRQKAENNETSLRMGMLDSEVTQVKYVDTFGIERNSIRKLKMKTKVQLKNDGARYWVAPYGRAYTYEYNGEYNGSERWDASKKIRIIGDGKAPTAKCSGLANTTSFNSTTNTKFSFAFADPKLTAWIYDGEQYAGSGFKNATVKVVNKTTNTTILEKTVTTDSYTLTLDGSKTAYQGDLAITVVTEDNVGNKQTAFSKTLSYSSPIVESLAIASGETNTGNYYVNGSKNYVRAGSKLKLTLKSYMIGTYVTSNRYAFSNGTTGSYTITNANVASGTITNAANSGYTSNKSISTPKYYLTTAYILTPNSNLNGKTLTITPGASYDKISVNNAAQAKSVIVDGTAPTISVSPTIPTELNAKTAFTFTATDSQSGVKTSTFSVKVQNLTKGTSKTYTADTTGKISLTIDPSKAEYQGRIKITATAADNVGNVKPKIKNGGTEVDDVIVDIYSPIVIQSLDVKGTDNVYKSADKTYYVRGGSDFTMNMAAYATGYWSDYMVNSNYIKLSKDKVSVGAPVVSATNTQMNEGTFDLNGSSILTHLNEENYTATRSGGTLSTSAEFQFPVEYDKVVLLATPYAKAYRSSDWATAQYADEEDSTRALTLICDAKAPKLERNGENLNNSSLTLDHKSEGTFTITYKASDEDGSGLKSITTVFRNHDTGETETYTGSNGTLSVTFDTTSKTLLLTPRFTLGKV